MQNILRGDGVPLEASELIPVIKSRKEMAEALASRFGDGTLAWFRGYADMSTNNPLVSDFNFLLELCQVQDQKIKDLQDKLSDANYKLESLGSSLEDA